MPTPTAIQKEEQGKGSKEPKETDKGRRMNSSQNNNAKAACGSDQLCAGLEAGIKAGIGSVLKRWTLA